MRWDVDADHTRRTLDPVTGTGSDHQRSRLRVHPALLYTGGRLGIFLLIGAVLYLLGFRSWFLLLVALVVSIPVSAFALRRQRAAWAARVEHAVGDRRSRRRRLRAQLRGDIPPD